MSWQGLVNGHTMSWLKMVMWHLSERIKWASQVKLPSLEIAPRIRGRRNKKYGISFSFPESLTGPSGMKVEPKKVVS